jgi:phospholipid/cholesterol/gamma-HCH transport system permease protein
LRQFGAEVFTINLIGRLTLRELGIFMTAIMVAGRSGSAFAAQIGTMKITEEIDAMRALGLDPIEVLVLPRILALVMVLPLLAFFANVMAMTGGAVMALIVLDITPGQFLTQLNQAIGLGTLMVGLVQAPVFAALIALVGCYEGFRVERSAESVGRQTTRAVVESIFLVIVATALFSILFSALGV